MSLDYNVRQVVNQTWSMVKLLQQFGVEVGEGYSMFFCPFPTHTGKETKRSAKYYEKSNDVFCFSEQKTFKPYDLLVMLGYSDDQILESVKDQLNDIDFELKDTKRREIVIPDFLKKASLMFRKSGNVLSLQNAIYKFLNEYSEE